MRAGAVSFYYFRDQQGLEIDFLLPSPQGRVMLIEARATHTASPGMADGVMKLAAAAGAQVSSAAVVYRAITTETRGDGAEAGDQGVVAAATPRAHGASTAGMIPPRGADQLGRLP